jgi:hypothetical protein
MVNLFLIKLKVSMFFFENKIKGLAFLILIQIMSFPLAEIKFKSLVLKIKENTFEITIKESIARQIVKLLKY